MKETAEEQILAAARRSIATKAAELAQQPAALRARLADDLAAALTEPPAGLAALLEALPAWDDTQLARLETIPAGSLAAIHSALEARYRELFPPESPVPAASALSLLDFDSEDEDESFSLLDFDQEDTSPEALRHPLGLLTQLLAAWYYVHHSPQAG